MTIVNIEFRANGNFGDLVSQINRVNASVSGLNKSLNSVNADGVHGLFKEFNTSMTRGGQYTSQIVQVTDATQKFGRALQDQTLGMRDHYTEFKKFVTKREGMIRQLAKQQTMMERSLVVSRGRNAQGQMQAQVLTPTGLPNDHATKLMQSRKELQIFNKVLNDGATSMINWGKNTQWAGRQLTVGLTVPLTIFAGTAAKTFYDMDMQLTRLAKVYGSSLQTMGQNPAIPRIKAQVVELSKELASTMGAKMEDTIGLAADLAATGKEGAALIGATRQATRLAVLGEVDRQQAMKATLSIQSVFNQDTKELTESIDFLNAVENQTSVSLEDLSTAIPKAGPVVRQLGGDIKDLSLFMVAMKEGGIPAAEAANALKSGLASIINPSIKARDSLKAFNIDIDKIVNSNKGELLPMVMDLKEALGGLEPLARARIIEQIFGKYQFARMSALFDNLGKQGSQTITVLDLMKQSTSDLADTAANEMKTLNESASGRFNRVWQTMRVNLAQVGEQFLNIATAILGKVNTIFDFFSKMPSGLKTFITIAAGVTALIGPVIMFAGIFGNFLGYLVKGVALLRIFARGGRDAFSLVTAESKAAEGAGKLFENEMYNQVKATKTMETAVQRLTAALQAMAKQSVEAAAVMNSGMRKVATGLPKPSMVPTGSLDRSHTMPVGKIDPYNPGGAFMADRLANAAVGDNPERMFLAGVSQDRTFEGLRPKQQLNDVTVVARQKAYAIQLTKMAAGDAALAKLITATGLSASASADRAAKVHALLSTEGSAALAQINELEAKIIQFYREAVQEATTIDQETEIFQAKINALVNETMPPMTGARRGQQWTEAAYSSRRADNNQVNIARYGMTEGMTGVAGQSYSATISPEAAKEVLPPTNPAAAPSGRSTLGIVPVGLPPKITDAADDLDEAGQKAGKGVATGGQKAAKALNGLSSFGLTAGTLAMMSGKGGGWQKFGEFATMLAITAPALQMIPKSAGWGKLIGGIKGLGGGAAGSTGALSKLGSKLSGLKGLGGMVAKLAPLAFGPWGIAIAGVGLGIAYLVKRHRDGLEKIKSQYTTTAASAEMLGIKIYDAAAQFVPAGKNADEYAAKLKDLQAQMDQMDSKETVRVFSDNLKGEEDPAKMQAMWSEFWRSQISQGANPEELKAVMQAALVRAGQEKYAFDLNIFLSKASEDRFKNLTVQLKDVMNESGASTNSIFLDNLIKGLYAAGKTSKEVEQYMADFKERVNESGASAQTVFSMMFSDIATLQDMTVPENFGRGLGPEFDGMAVSIGNAATEAAQLSGTDFSTFRDQLLAASDAGGVAGNRWGQVQDTLIEAGGSTGILASRASSYADMINIAKLDMLGMVAASTEAARNLQIGAWMLESAFDASLAGAQKGASGFIAKNAKAPTGGGSAKPKDGGGGGDPYAKQKDALQDQIKHEDDLIEKINDRREAEKKALAEKKRILDFEKSMYEKQIGYREALAAGDFGAAAVIKNDMAISRKEFNADTKDGKKDDAADAEIKAHEKKKDALQKQIDKYEKMSQAASKAAAASAKAGAAGVATLQAVTQKAQEESDKLFKNLETKNLKNKDQLVGYMSKDLKNALKAAGISVETFAAYAWKTYSDEMKENVDEFKKVYPKIEDAIKSIGGDAFFLRQVMIEVNKGSGLRKAIIDALNKQIPKIGPNGKPITGQAARNIRHENEETGNAAAARGGAHAGGPVDGRDHMTGSIPSSEEMLYLLQKGEYVIRKSAVSKYGKNMMERINAGNFNGMGQSVKVASGGGGGYNGTIVNIYPKDGASAEEIYKVFKRRMDQEESRKGKKRR